MPKRKHKKSKKFVFLNHASIGSADAVEDSKFLSESFVDKGELAILQSLDDPRCVVVGRTGTGKTALLQRLKATEDRVLEIAPEHLALTYVSNNEVLRFFTAAGVDMQLFYRLLWRHVFATEIIKERYQIINERSRDSFLSKMRDRLLNNKSKQDAVDYLQKWGETFWEETDSRVKEVTTKLERDLGASIEATGKFKIPMLVDNGAKLNAALARKLTEEEKAEVVQRGQAVVNKVQIKTLSQIIKLLEEDILDDKYKKYYITIDRLDENWVNNELRYHLIRALLETIRDFNRNIQNVKIIIALREDLVDRVFRYTRGAGYQQEKHDSLRLWLTWNESELIELVDARISQLIREQYTSHQVKMEDLLPRTINNSKPLKYLLSRTMLRPRDIIMFLNECLRGASRRANLTRDIIVKAETVYSLNRLKALADEWIDDYPNLIELSFFLKKYPQRFRLNGEVAGQIENSMLEFLVKDELERDDIFSLVERKFDENDVHGFMQEMVRIFYRVGLVGVKPETYQSVSWSYQKRAALLSEIDQHTTIHIHRAFWQVLGIKLDKR